MSITGAMVLPTDLLIMPAADFDDERIGACGPDDYVVTRPQSRASSRVVNAPTAELLEEFREPQTIVGAVLALAARTGADHELLLEQVLSALAPFIQTQWLVPVESYDAKAVEPKLAVGEVAADCTILECCQLLEDSEVYRVRTADKTLAALKLCIADENSWAAKSLHREVQILTRLRDSGDAEHNPAPTLLQSGECDGRPCMVTSWAPGIPVSQAAEETRQLLGAAGITSLLTLCCAMLDAYAELHRRRVIHGDVYPMNVIVGTGGRIAIIDYGLAVCSAAPEISSPRGGVVDFFEPEYARAALAGSHSPPLTERGEQYAVAALCYLIITGGSYVDFSAERESMLAQISEQPPLTFAERGCVRLTGVEAVLGRALSKEPLDRFGSIQDFSTAFADAVSRVGRRNVSAPQQLLGDAEELIATLVESDPHVMSLPRSVPLASVTYGAAGIAHALHCLALTRNSPRLLEAADGWGLRAAELGTRHNAFTHDRLDLPEHVVRPTSVFYGQAGVPLVQALIAESMGDERSLHAGVAEFVSAAESPCSSLDVTLGSAGVLVACSLLLDAVSHGAPYFAVSESAHALVDLAVGQLASISDGLAIETGGHLGVAHGLAGMCYAALLWSEVSGAPVPQVVRDRLAQLSACAENRGRGLRWPITTDSRQPSDSQFMESWCHGSPGYVPLWTAAYRVLGAVEYLETAERAAWTVWDAQSIYHHACCGDAGRAYALLNIYRNVDDRQWLDRAKKLAMQSASACGKQPDLRYSLFKGDLGVVLLLQDVHDPERAGLPLFERNLRGA